VKRLSISSICESVNLATKNRTVVGLCLTALVVVLYWLSIGTSNTARAAGLKGALLQRAQELNQLQCVRERLEVCRRKLERLRSQLDELRSGFDARPETHRFLAELHEKATECGVDLNRIEPEERRSCDGFYVIPMSIEAAGSYPALCSYLGELQRGGKVLRIKELKIRRADPLASEHGGCQLRVVLELVSLEEEAD